MNTGLEKIRAWFRRARKDAKDVAEGEEPATTSAFDDMDVETSTNAQVQGAVGEPYDE